MRLQAVHEETRMSSTCRREVVLDADVDLEPMAAEPAAATRRERRRLLDFVEAEQAQPEGPRRSLRRGWGGELDVVDYRFAATRSMKARTAGCAGSTRWPPGTSTSSASGTSSAMRADARRGATGDSTPQTMMIG